MKLATCGCPVLSKASRKSAHCLADWSPALSLSISSLLRSNAVAAARAAEYSTGVRTCENLTTEQVIEQSVVRLDHLDQFLCVLRQKSRDVSIVLATFDRSCK